MKPRIYYEARRNASLFPNPPKGAWILHCRRRLTMFESFGMTSGMRRRCEDLRLTCKSFEDALRWLRSLYEDGVIIREAR